ncbi:MAG TPA: outer membrane beta-barrel protein [Gammaproteobacteria bacterium]|nr:outer membrane beta-barrel protein [Gammaproteobacteria bacterium]
MKKMTKISATVASLLIVGAANAATPGVYVGAGAGGSILRTPDVTTSNPIASTSEKRGGLGGRIFAGYNFNKYFGLEAAFAAFASSSAKASALGMSASEKYSQNALSLVGKGYLPLGESGFNAYALGGVSEVYGEDRYKRSYRGTQLANNSQTTRALRPTYGVGVSYDVADHMTTSLEVSRIQGKGNMKTDSHAIPNADMATLNLGYNFG